MPYPTPDYAGTVKRLISPRTSGQRAPVASQESLNNLFRRLRIVPSGGSQAAPTAAVPPALAADRDASIRAYGYGQPDQRGGYSSAPATGYTPVPVQSNLNPTSHFGSLAGGGQRAAAINLAAAQSAAQGIPNVSPFRLRDEGGQDMWVRHVMNNPGVQLTMDGVKMPPAVKMGAMTPQALANYQQGHYGTLLKRLGIVPAAGTSGADLKSQYLAARDQRDAARVESKKEFLARVLRGGSGARVSGNFVPPGTDFRLPFVWNRELPKMEQAPKFIAHLMDQKNLAPQQALAALQEHFTGQELERIAADHSPGFGVSDFGDWVLGGESDALIQRKARAQWLTNLGIVPPGQAQVPAAPSPATSAQGWGIAPESMPRAARWKSGFEM
jgi:hypothetical protein